MDSTSAFECFRPLLLFYFITGQLLVENGFAQHYNLNKTRLQFISVLVCLVWFMCYVLSTTYFTFLSTQLAILQELLGIVLSTSEGLFLFLWLFLSGNLIISLDIIDKMQLSLSKFTGQPVSNSTGVLLFTVALLVGLHSLMYYSETIFSTDAPVWVSVIFTYADCSAQRQMLIISVFYFLCSTVIRDCRRYWSLNLHTMASNDYYSLVHYCHLVLAQTKFLKEINKSCHKLILLFLTARVYFCTLFIPGCVLGDDSLYCYSLGLSTWTAVTLMLIVCFNKTAAEFNQLAREVMTLKTKRFSKRNTKNVRVLLAAVGCGEKDLQHLGFIRISPRLVFEIILIDINCVMILAQNISHLRHFME